jgi:hypothetical protein
LFDPDGKLTDDSTTNGPDKSLWLVLYTTGRVTDISQVDIGTANSGGALGPFANHLPTWFSW